MDKFVLSEPKRVHTEEPMTDSPSDTTLYVSFPTIPKKNYSYQNHWDEKYTWPVYIKEKDHVFCRHCKWFSESGKRFASKFVKTTFTSEGFSNWKKALEKLATHEASAIHKEAVSAHAIFIGQWQGIEAVLFSKKQQQKVVGREAMKVIFDTSKTMARQAIAFRGHTEVDSNFYQIIRLVARSGSHCMQSWLEKKYDWTSPESQNGILKVLYRGVMAVLLDSIKCSPGGLFAVMVDDTTDISNVEQMSLCLRYVKDDLTVSEIFLGFIETPSTTEENMYKQLRDSLNALGLSLDQCASFSRLEEHSGSVGLRSLCSTRWVCREPALKSFVHNYERLLKWFAELTTAGCVSDKRVALGYFNSLRKFKNYFSILLLQKIFTTVHWTHLAIQKPNLSITKCTEKINNLLAILKAECTAEAGASLYHSCVQESRPVENGGIGILQPEVPRGWRGSYSVDQRFLTFFYLSTPWRHIRLSSTPLDQCQVRIPRLGSDSLVYRRRMYYHQFLKVTPHV